MYVHQARIFSPPGYKTDSRLAIGFQNPSRFKSPPPPVLNILTVPDWLNVKFHYFATVPKVKILNTFNSIGSHLRNSVSIVITRVNSFTPLTNFS